MLKVRLVLIYLVIPLLFTVYAVDVETQAKFEDGNTCVVKAEQCSIKVRNQRTEPGKQGEMGHKGEKGDRGSDGTNGLLGGIGPKGDKGYTGPTGIKGDKGLKGEKGYDGRQGEPGKPGTPGRDGPPGNEGTKGDQGSTGLRGPPGIPGLSGSCPCQIPTKEETDADDRIKTKPLGSLENPAQILCNKWVNESTLGEYYMGPGNMKVSCQMREDKNTRKKALWTCILPKEVEPLSEDTTAEPLEEKAYWLSSKKVGLENIYGLDLVQLAWLQELAILAYQELRYHCKNSAIYNPSKEDSSLLLLSWNDILFDRTPQATTPFTYNAPEEFDDCSKSVSSGKSRSSLIVIESDSRRLPVVDFKIRDLRDKFADIRIEHVNLCFY